MWLMPASISAFVNVSVRDLSPVLLWHFLSVLQFPHSHPCRPVCLLFCRARFRFVYWRWHWQSHGTVESFSHSRWAGWRFANLVYWSKWNMWKPSSTPITPFVSHRESWSVVRLSQWRWRRVPLWWISHTVVGLVIPCGNQAHAAPPGLSSSGWIGLLSTMHLQW